VKRLGPDHPGDFGHSERGVLLRQLLPEHRREGRELADSRPLPGIQQEPFNGLRLDPNLLGGDQGLSCILD
jgi:hypothetical protein